MGPRVSGFPGLRIRVFEGWHRLSQRFAAACTPIALKARAVCRGPRCGTRTSKDRPTAAPEASLRSAMPVWEKFSMLVRGIPGLALLPKDQVGWALEGRVYLYFRNDVYPPANLPKAERSTRGHAGSQSTQPRPRPRLPWRQLCPLYLSDDWLALCTS